MIDSKRVFDHLDQYVTRIMEMSVVPGISLALTNHKELLYATTFGFSNVVTQTPVSGQTLFEIGSIGKSLTSVVLLQEHEAGRLNLNAPVTEYLPWFEVKSQYKPITVHHLMSHTAGITRGTDLAPYGYYEVMSLSETHTGFPPGERFYYSNVGYKALGLLLEELVGQCYGDIIQSRILAPLDMTNTHAVITHETRSIMANGYCYFYDDRPAHASHSLVSAPWHEYGTGDGSPASTAEDMTIYLRMLMNEGQGSGERILSKKSFKLMTRRMAEAWGSAYCGYGLFIMNIDGHIHIGHPGGTLGYRAWMLADIEDGLGVVVLVNGPENPYDLADYTLKLARAMKHNLDLPPQPPKADNVSVGNAPEYAGKYRKGNRTIEFTAKDNRLIFQKDSSQVILERRGWDTFYARHDDFALFLLRFQRDREGRVVEVFYGPDWYINDLYRDPVTFDYPKEWEAYVGHYRSHNPWLSNFRIVMHKDKLVYIQQGGGPGGGEQLLVPLGDATFRVGQEEHVPERLRFSTLVNGQALRANLSGCDYYRTFTP